MSYIVHCNQWNHIVYLAQMSWPANFLCEIKPSFFCNGIKGICRLLTIQQPSHCQSVHLFIFVLNSLHPNLLQINPINLWLMIFHEGKCQNSTYNFVGASVWEGNILQSRWSGVNQS
jgi:hypothetical protein